MATASEHCLPAPLAEHDSRPTATGRQAFYFSSQQQPLFAWLHSRQDGLTLEHGVIVCPPVGYEQLHAHRALRHLADALANHGIPVLRFDWHGTGDSAGTDEDPDRCAAWLANLRDAAEWMQTQLGCRRLSVVGLRMGALIAAKALGEFDCENFVLWAPVTSGRSYVREMQLIDRTAETQPRSGEAKPGEIEAVGLVLTSETAAELTSWNLLKLEPKCQRVLVAGRSDAPAESRLLERFTSLGIPAEQIIVPGTAEIFIEPHYNQVPSEAIAQIESWLSRQILTDAAPAKAAEAPLAGPDEATMWQAAVWHAGAPAATSEAGQLIRERALRICGEPELFGILTQPVEPDESLPILVLLNSGSVHRVGTGRINVALARQFAAEGFRCLRMDLCGLGDSVLDDSVLADGVSVDGVSAHSSQENHPYPATTFRDIEIALEELRNRLGMRRAVLVGLCSGAYAAFQSAVQLKDAALVESVLINPLTYFWRDGMSLNAATAEEILRQHRCLARALEPKKLIKLLTGRTQIGIFGAIRVLAKSLMQRRPPRDGSPADHGALPAASGPCHPRVNDLPGDLARLAASGRDLAMFFATTDPGYSILMCQARRQASRLRKLGRLQVAFIKNADHTFSRRGPRRDLVQALSAHLRGKYRSANHAELPES